MLSRSDLPLSGQEIIFWLRSGVRDRGKVLEVRATALVLEGEDGAHITIDPSAIDGWFRYPDPPAPISDLGWLVTCGLCDFKHRFAHIHGVDDNLQAQGFIDESRAFHPGVHEGLAYLRIVKILPEMLDASLKTEIPDAG